MLEHSLNIGGSEWMIIIFAAVVLVLGTGKLPGVAKKMGKVMSEYNNAKNEIQQQMKEVTEEIPKISGPVETEREKLEMISKSVGIKTEGKTDEELQKEISLKMGQKQQTPLKKQQTPLKKQQTPLKKQQTPLKKQQTLVKQNKNYFVFLIRYMSLSNLFLANL